MLGSIDKWDIAFKSGLDRLHMLICGADILLSTVMPSLPIDCACRKLAGQITFCYASLDASSSEEDLTLCNNRLVASLLYLQTNCIETDQTIGSLYKMILLDEEILDVMLHTCIEDKYMDMMCIGLLRPTNPEQVNMSTRYFLNRRHLLLDEHALQDFFRDTSHVFLKYQLKADDTTIIPQAGGIGI